MNIKHTLLLLVTFSLFYVYSSAQRSRVCFREGAYCNPLYLCPCCPRLYFEDGTDQGLTNNDGLFCNMQGAVVVSSDAYPQGCCQRCTTEGANCTTEFMPCCPDHTPVSDVSCPTGQTKCKKIDTVPIYKDRNSVDSECAGTMPECYTETMYCRGNLWKCCPGLVCNTTVEYNGYGVCERDSGFTGTLDPPPTPRPLPIASLDPQCPGWTNVTTSTVAPTTIPSTSTAPTTGPASSATSVTCPPPKNQQKPGTCQSEGGYCDDSACCENLKCPENWWPLWILRWLLNWIGLWYRRCRNYSPLTWYNPFTWYDY